MIDINIIAILVLAIVVLAQVAERYIYAKLMTGELSKCLKAVMSRNINEYIAATTADKPVRTTQVQSDEVALDEASQEEFEKFIQAQTK